MQRQAAIRALDHEEYRFHRDGVCIYEYRCINALVRFICGDCPPLRPAETTAGHTNTVTWLISRSLLGIKFIIFGFRKMPHQQHRASPCVDRSASVDAKQTVIGFPRGPGRGCSCDDKQQLGSYIIRNIDSIEILSMYLGIDASVHQRGSQW